MRRNRLLFIALIALIGLLGFIGLTGCAKKEIKNIGSRGKNIICFGDSITLGYGAAPGEGFPAILNKMLGLPVINSGIDGDTTQEALRRLKSDVLESKPLLVIIEFGGNDFLRRIPFKQTIKNIEEMVKRIEASGAMVAIADISSSILMSDYGKEYKRLSREYHAIYIPGLLRGIITNPDLKSDFIHPNSQGYKMVAHRIYRAILPYLNQNLIDKKLVR